MGKLFKLKESHLVQTARFAVLQGIYHKPAFNYKVKLVLNKRDRIITNIRKYKIRYLKRSHKLVIELLKTVEQAYALNSNNGNTLWADTLYKEMDNVRVAFEVLPDGKSGPI